MRKKLNSVLGMLFATAIMAWQCSVPAFAAKTDTASKLSPAADPTGLLHVNDSRLKVLITLHKPECTLAEALIALRDITHIALKVKDGEENAGQRISLRYKSVALRDIMDSLAYLYDMTWQRKGNTYILYSQRQKENDEEATHPHSEAEATVYREGNAFLQQLKKLPPETQQALYLNNEDNASTPNPGLPFTALPPAMQQAVRALFTASCEEDEAWGLPSPFSASDLSSSHVRLQGGAGGLSSGHLSLDIGNTKGSMSIGFQVFPDSNEDHYRVIATHPGNTLPTSKSLPASSEETLQNDVRLKRKITFRGSHLTFIEALQQLSLQPQINFVAEKGPADPVTKSFAYVEVSLEEALNRLGSLYASTRDMGQHVNFFAPGVQLIPQNKNEEGELFEHYVYAWRLRNSGLFVFRSVLDDPRIISPATSSPLQPGQALSPRN